jgi:putative RecB family exonuclease
MRMSYSRFSTYKLCSQQYKLQYVDKIPVAASPAMHFGSAVHEALKFMYDPRHLRRPEVEQVIEAFAQAWRARETEVEEERRQDYFEQGVDMLRRHYEGHARQEEGRRTAATERFFNIPFDGDHTLTGYVDRVDVLPGNRLEIIDYKTSRTMPSERDMAKNAQLAIYRMAADHLYPGREVTTTLLFLLHDFRMELTQTEEFLEEKREEIRETIARIERGQFDPNPGNHCDWCDYRAHCPLFREPVVPEGLEVDVAALLREYAAADEQQKEAAARRGELRAAIEEYLDQCQAQRIEGGGYVAERRAVKRVSSWDVDRLRKLLEPLGLWDNVTQVNTTAVRRLLSSQDLSWEEKRSVEAAAEHSESKQLRVKPLSRGEEGEDTEE